MATQLIQGTKEYLIIDVVDKKGTLTSLDGTNPRFTIYDVGGTKWYTDEPANNVGLSAFCLIDTSAAHSMGLWPVGEYRITLKVDTLPEVPVIEPGRFTIVAP